MLFRSVSNRLSEKFGKLWIAAEVLLFVLVGAAVDIRYTLNAGPAAAAMILLALLFRSAAVCLCLLGTQLTGRERLFCIIAYLPKQLIAEDFAGRILDEGKITPASFLGGKLWYPTAQPAPQFGVLPLILGTLWVSLAAILIALPFGLAVAIYMAELAGHRLRSLLKPVIELLAGIPSVVYGFFGLVVIVPLVQRTFSLPVGETGLAGTIILAIMSLPPIFTVAEDPIPNTPRAMKESSLALGATHWQTIRKVVVPYSISGITAAVVLGIGRALGETMAVLMVTGNAAVMPHTLLEPLRTIPATIAAELGEAPAGGAHYEALFLLGCILFLLTLVISISVEMINAKRPKQSV